MAEKVKLCIVCGARPAELPDRNTFSRVKKVCRLCHSGRLTKDFRDILTRHAAEGRE